MEQETRDVKSPPVQNHQNKRKYRSSSPGSSQPTFPLASRGKLLDERGRERGPGTRWVHYRIPLRGTKTNYNKNPNRFSE
jgi:hypothetical protein